MSKKWLPGEAIPNGWYWLETRIEHPRMMYVNDNKNGFRPDINPARWVEMLPEDFGGWVLYGPISIEEIKGGCNEKVEL